MATAEFETEITMPMLGVAVIVGIDDEGGQKMQIANFGDARLWTMIGMLQGALDDCREQLQDHLRDADEDADA